jgi:hypothetical protein
LYDIEVLSRTSFFQKALADRNLHDTIVAHRSKFSRLEGVDYAKHVPPHIKIVPPENLLPLWEKDYNEMVENMIYGEKLPFNELILKITDIQNEINAIYQS